MIDILPDSRCKNATGIVQVNGVNHVPIFCMNCGTPGGLVTERGINFVGWMCDSCQEKYPLPPGTYALPDDEHNRRVAEELAKAGPLNLNRIAELLKDDRSTLARLAKDNPNFGNK
jgi:hypothetical protein